MTSTYDQAQPEGLRERKKEQTRRALHRAALEIICERGPDAATIEDIASRAGVSRRTFFNYYPSRESVLTSSNPDATGDLLTAVRDAPEGEPVPQLLREAVQAWVNAAITDTEMARLRKRAIEAWPDFGAMVAAANTSVTRQVHQALVDRPDVEDDLQTAIALQVAMGVARSVYMEYARTGFSADLPALMAHGFETAATVAAAF